MKKLWVAAVVLAASLPLSVAAQDAQNALKDYSRVLSGDVQLTLVHVNGKTLPVLFQPPTLYAIRARMGSSTVLYVQGNTSKNIELDTTNFIIEQDGESLTAAATNIKNFQTGKVAKGERIDGLLVVPKLVDISKPFTVKHGKNSIEFKFSADQVKAASPAPAAQ